MKGVGLTLATLLFGGGWIISKSYRVSFARGMYESLALIVFASELSFPEHNIWLSLLWILFPLIGLFGFLNALTSFSNIFKLGDVTSKEWNNAVVRTMKEHVIIVGLGNVGLRVLEALSVNTTYSILCIDKFTGEDAYKIPHYQKKFSVPVIKGDAQDIETLKEARIEKARFILALIDNDLINLKIALLAKKLNPSIKTIIRMFDVEFGELVQDEFNIGQIISTTKIAAPVFLQVIRDLEEPM